jgi:DNA repair protein SbcC/Rad50
MIPVRIELKNFLAYRSPDPLRFEGIHLACLTGANGAGKSSLLDAITWALWGRARAKRDDDMIYLSQSDMHVQLDFEQEGTVYRVIRKRSRRQRGVSALDFFSQVDGDWITQSEPAIRDTQSKINRLLRLDYETFVHSAFLQQGKADAFTTKAPAQRKQILSDILGLAQWEQYEDATKDTLKNITAELAVIDVRINEIEKELEKMPRLQEVLVEAEAAQREAQESLAAAEVKLEEVAHAPAEMRNAQERMADCERHKRERERDLEAIAVDIERQTARAADYQDIIEAREDIEAGYAALQLARDTDSALADKLMQLSDFDAERRELEIRLRDARAELENEATGYQARIAELQRALDLADPDELGVVQSEVFMLAEKENERGQVDEETRALSEEKASLTGRREALEAEGKNINKRLAELKATQDPICPLCGQPLDEDHRAQLIGQLEQEVVERRVDYTTNQDRIKQITADLKTRQHYIGELDVELKRLQPLRERASQLQMLIDSADAAQSRVTEEQARLDAVNVMLENETFAQDIREQLASLDTQRAQIGYDRSSHDSARQQLDTYREYEVRQKQLELALSALPDVQAALDGAILRLERTEKAIADDLEKIDDLKTEIAQLDVLVKEQQIRQQEVNRLRMFERTQYQRLLNAQQELDALDKQRIRKNELEDRREQRRHDEALFKELRAAFGKNGVPAMIIEAAIPELEDSANRLLSRMTDGRMNLHFSTQKEKADGEGVIETLDIQIADELGTRSYEMYSGGEAFRINFAIRVALSQLLARRAGAHLRTLFIDEGFGTQDEDGRNKLVEAINAIQNDFELILVITHIDDLRDSFPVHVIVEKTPNGSRISVR